MNPEIKFMKTHFTFSLADEEEEEEIAPPQPVVEAPIEKPDQKEEEEGAWARSWTFRYSVFSVYFLPGGFSSCTAAKNIP